nr:retrovirus-related Pol polyprotein from transposon TNT 1-94 [Tanacetum cinerariifolium]
MNGASSSKVNYDDSGKNNKRNNKKRKDTWNSSKENKKYKKLLSKNSNKKDESANAVEQVDTTEITAMVSELNIGMIQELHMASVTTTDDWWYDSGATTHVCNNRDFFKTYKETKDGHEVMMGNNHTLKVIGSGNVEIQFTSGKKLTLMNVLHVPNIRKNLVSGFKLCKSRVKAVIESNKVILSKANVFVGKAYAEDFTLDQIQKHLRIEKETRIREKNLNGASSSKVNYVDLGKNNKGNNKNRNGTWNSSKEKKKDKKPLSEVVCYKCGEKGHIKCYCKNPKKKNQNSNKKDESANVIGSGNVEIQFTSGKKLTLMNVLHVPNIRKNLVSGFKLCKSGVNAVIERTK